MKRLTASLCDALLQSSGSRETLLALASANIFLIPLDAEGHWYRYHGLFADFLRQRLNETRPEIVPELHLRASLWCETQGMAEEAIDYAFASGNSERAARLLDDTVRSFLFNGEVARVLRWVSRVPEEVRSRYARLCIYHAWALQFEYQLESAESALSLAEAYLKNSEESSGSFPADQIACHAHAIRAFSALKRKEYVRAVDLALAAQESLPNGNARELKSLRGIILLGLGMAYVEQGQIKAACGNLSQALANGESGLLWIEEQAKGRGEQRQLRRMLAGVQLQTGRVLYERNELSRAARCIESATEYYEKVQSWNRISGYLLLVDLYQALGDVDTALAYLRKLKAFRLMPEIADTNIYLAAQIMQRNLLLYRMRPASSDLLMEAVNWAASSGLTADDEFLCEQEPDYVALAHVLIARDRADEASTLLERLINCAELSERQGRLIAYLCLKAVACSARGRTDDALLCLARAFALGEPESYVRTFVDLGPAMQDLLLSAVQWGAADGYALRLLAVFPGSGRESGSEDGGPAQPAKRKEQLVEALNEREIQILSLLAVRHSYKEIAYELCLSVNTIKWYAKNVYGKLGVNKKEEAAVRARELSIL